MQHARHCRVGQFLSSSSVSLLSLCTATVCIASPHAACGLHTPLHPCLHGVRHRKLVSTTSIGAHLIVCKHECRRLGDVTKRHPVGSRPTERQRRAVGNLSPRVFLLTTPGRNQPMKGLGFRGNTRMDDTHGPRTDTVRSRKTVEGFCGPSVHGT